MLPVEGKAVIHNSLLVLLVHVKFATVSTRSSIIPDITGSLSTMVSLTVNGEVTFITIVYEPV